MNKQVQTLILWFLVISLALAGCSSGNRIGGTSKHCGCGMNKGMVGY